jgi:hypothetical protein
VVVRVDPHRERVGGARERVRRLEHLARVEGVEVGVVVAHLLGRGEQDGLGIRADPLDARGGQRLEPVLQALQRVAEGAEGRLVQKLGSSIGHVR